MPYDFQYHDSDFDGVSNYDELLAGTNPEAADSDAAINNPANLTPGGYLPGTLTALVEVNGALEALRLLKNIGLDQALNEPSNPWTVFLPNDAALAEFGGTMDAQSHIFIHAPINTEEFTGSVSYTHLTLPTTPYV